MCNALLQGRVWNALVTVISNTEVGNHAIPARASASAP